MVGKIKCQSKKGKIDEISWHECCNVFTRNAQTNLIHYFPGKKLHLQPLGPIESKNPIIAINWIRKQNKRLKLTCSQLLLSECSRVMWVWASEAFSCFHLRPPEEATSAVLLASASSGSAPSHSCDYFLSLLSSEVQANLSAAHIIHFIYYLFLCTSNSYQLFRTEYQDLRKIIRWAKKIGPHISITLKILQKYILQATC